MLVQAKRLANESFNPIAIDRPAQMFFCHRHTQTRVTATIASCQ